MHNNQSRPVQKETDEFSQGFSVLTEPAHPSQDEGKQHLQNPANCTLFLFQRFFFFFD